MLHLELCRILTVLLNIGNINNIDNDFDNLLVAVVASFILGFVMHSSLAHYLPDSWSLYLEVARVRKWLKGVIKWLLKNLLRS